VRQITNNRPNFMLLYRKQITGSPSDLRCRMPGRYFASFSYHRQGKASARPTGAHRARLDYGLHRKANEYRLRDRTRRGAIAGELR
jgi:hypothetical protein